MVARELRKFNSENFVCVSGTTLRVCSLIKTSAVRNPEKEPLTIMLPSATTLVEKFECGRRREQNRTEDAKSLSAKFRAHSKFRIIKTEKRVEVQILGYYMI